MDAGRIFVIAFIATTMVWGSHASASRGFRPAPATMGEKYCVQAKDPKELTAAVAALRDEAAGVVRRYAARRLPESVRGEAYAAGRDWLSQNGRLLLRDITRTPLAWDTDFTRTAEPDAPFMTQARPAAPLSFNTARLWAAASGGNACLLKPTVVVWILRASLAHLGLVDGDLAQQVLTLLLAEG